MDLEDKKNKPDLNANSQIKLVSMTKLRVDGKIYSCCNKVEKEESVYIYFNFGEKEVGYLYDKEQP